MNRNTFYRIFLFSVIAISVTSCSKWLELKPQDGIIRQEYWKTKEQVQSAVVGCYSSLLGPPSGSDKPLSELFFYGGELRGTCWRRASALPPMSLT